MYQRYVSNHIHGLNSKNGHRVLNRREWNLVIGVLR